MTFNSLDLRETGEDLVLHAGREVGVLWIAAEVFERENRDAFLKYFRSGYSPAVSGESGQRAAAATASASTAMIAKLSFRPVERATDCSGGDLLRRA